MMPIMASLTLQGFCEDQIDNICKVEHSVCFNIDINQYNPIG